MEVYFNRLAIKDYRMACQWYTERSPQAATRFIAAIDEAVNRIGEVPDSLPVLSGKYRWVRVKKFPLYSSLLFQLQR